jgi:tRNA (guanine37-N1)-methyltransferase
VLVSGNHAQIDRWRRIESLKRTWLRRPDLLEKIELSSEDEKNLEKIKLDQI